MINRNPKNTVEIQLCDDGYEAKIFDNGKSKYGFNMTINSAPDYDTWLLRGSGINDPECGPGEFDFNMKLRGGTVKVKAHTEYQDDSDEDGYRTITVAIVDTVSWSFDEEWEVNLTKDEENEVDDQATEIMNDY